LIKKDELVTDFSSDVTSKTFIEKKHARTAVCVKPNHNWLFVVAEHTKEKTYPFVTKINHGLTILELAHLMKTLGCQDAINLDGGGSSVMVLNQRIMNETVGDMDEILHINHERPVLNAILVLPK
jgi:exopolysaccharide biosynthesis protein